MKIKQYFSFPKDNILRVVVVFSGLALFVSLVQLVTSFLPLLYSSDLKIPQRDIVTPFVNSLLISIACILAIGVACFNLRINGTVLNLPFGVRLICLGIVVMYSQQFTFIVYLLIVDNHFLIKFHDGLFPDEATIVSIFVLTIILFEKAGSIIACYGLLLIRRWGRVLIIVTLCIDIIIRLIVHIFYGLIERLLKETGGLEEVIFKVVILLVEVFAIWYLSRRATRQFFIETNINRQCNN